MYSRIKYSIRTTWSPGGRAMIVTSPGPPDSIPHLDGDRAWIVVGPALSDSNIGGRCHGEIDIEPEDDRDQREQNSCPEYKSTVHEVSYTSGALRSISSRFRRFPDPGLTNPSAHAASADTINQDESGDSFLDMMLSQHIEPRRNSQSPIPTVGHWLLSNRLSKPPVPLPPPSYLRADRGRPARAISGRASIPRT